MGCSIYKFMQDQGAEEFAPYVCLSDIALSNTFGWELIRTETLAGGSKRCDFRFKKGGKTKISSTVWEKE
ncbi:MAG: L-2-amino-thiazoline-4-carboxylic acid hydrolase [bacterium]